MLDRAVGVSLGWEKIPESRKATDRVRTSSEKGALRMRVLSGLVLAGKGAWSHE